MKSYVLAFISFVFWSTALRAQNEKSAEAFSKSYLYENAKDYKNAINAIESAGTNDFYEAQLRLGWLHYLSGNYFKSIEHYKKAISLKNKSVEARLGLAYPLYAMGNIEDLIKNYLDILLHDASNYTVNYRLASLYLERKQYEQALQFAQKLIELYPFDYNSNLIAARIFVGLGKVIEARKCYYTCLLFSPSDADILAALKKL
ncbi:MAG: tetratricopeptide repeat protein [Chitinophagales bacterium]|nr:tetratricopeptide repeat protein [Chitinophagales bacterium]MDW8273817.1 tetratricopeptide repeat protein [Chitinophagales bacterium]